MQKIPHEANRSTRHELHALVLAVGPDAAPRVEKLLTPVPIAAGSSLARQRGLPGCAFFVLEGRLAITVAERPLAVLGPGSFLGAAGSTQAGPHDVMWIHALGPVVIGVAGPREMWEIHHLVPDLGESTIEDAPVASGVRTMTHHDDEDFMGLGVLERIAG